MQEWSFHVVFSGLLDDSCKIKYYFYGKNMVIVQQPFRVQQILLDFALSFDWQIKINVTEI